MATIVCKSCGCIMNENVKFCNECGASITYAESSAQVNKPKICPNCKMTVPSGKSYCTNCGTILYSNMSQSFFNETKPKNIPTRNINKDEISDYTDPAYNARTITSDGYADALSSSRERSEASQQTPSFFQQRDLSQFANSQTAQQQDYSTLASQFVSQSGNAAKANPDTPKTSYASSFDGFRPTVSDSGNIPSFSVQGNAPTAAYSEQIAYQAGAEVYSHSQQTPAYADLNPYSSVSQPSQPVQSSHPSGSAQPYQSSSAVSNNYPPIDYTQTININNESIDANAPQAKKSVYIDDYDEDIYEEERPDHNSKYEPVSTWGFVGIMLLAGIPIIGWIFILVWACGGCRKVNKSSYARAVLIITLINILITCLLTYLIVNLFSSAAQQIMSAFGDMSNFLSIML